MQDGNAGLPVVGYLRPEEQVVPFRTRPELQQLLSWCAAEGHARVRLVTGDGGAGKTRLALRLGEELAAIGWQPLWMPSGAERDAVAAVHELGRPCVLVVDYAETRAELAKLLDEVAADRGGPALRALLLARSAGEWWQQLLARVHERTATLLEADAPVAIGPVRAAGGPLEVFDDAVTAFSRKLRVGRPDAKLTLADPDPLVLVVHAAALLAVVDHATGFGRRHPAATGSQVLDALLRHEARYWVRTAAARDLVLDLSVLRLVVAVGCLIGADNETAAGALLANIPDLDSAERRGQVARWLHDLYPGVHASDTKEQEWLGPLRPDRVAEQLIASELTRRQDLIGPLFSALSHARAARGLTVLARAALNQDRVIDLIHGALASDFEHLALPAMSVAIETNSVLGELLVQVAENKPVSRETLQRVASETPYPTLALGELAALVCQRLADSSTTESEHAKWLVDLSNRLGDLGRPEDALAALEQAVGIYRQFAEINPGGLLPQLAASLNNLSKQFGKLGRREDALAAIEEATGIYRRAGRGPPGRVPARPGHVAEQPVVRLGDSGPAGGGAGRDRGSRRHLPGAGRGPPGRVPARPGHVAEQPVGRLRDLGRREEALAAIEEAVDHLPGAGRGPPGRVPARPGHVAEQPVGSAGGPGPAEEALAAIEEAVSHLPGAGRGPPGRVPARPGHVAEQPSNRLAGWAGGRRRWPRSRKPSPSTGSWPRPARTRSGPTWPGR